MHIVTFNTCTLPASVKIGYLRYEVRTFYLNPLRCIKCLTYGHTKNHCTEQNEYYKECGEISHPNVTCDIKQCRNCPKPQSPIHHTSLTPDCPVRRRKKAIIEIKINNRMSHWQVKQEFQSING
jgi:hypothetical protein